MQKLSLDEEEKLSRKEYLKKKKKQNSNIKSGSKVKYIVIFFATVLSLYVFVQFYIYYKDNNFKYLSDENVEKQPVYDMYYVSVGYTYSPKSSLNKIKSNSFDETLVYKDLGFTNIKVNNEYIYGIRENSLCRLNKNTNDITVLYEKDVNKYIMYKNEIYLTVGDNSKLKYINSDSLEVKEFPLENVTEILVDDSNLYLCIDETSKKVLYKTNKEAGDKKALTNNENVSYIIQDNTRIFFVNKSDENKIYSIQKDSSGVNKVSDIKSVSDTGNIKDVDGSKYMFVESNNLYYINTDDKRNLWKINLDDKSVEKVISMPVDIFEVVEKTVFYKVEDEKGVYLFNLETKFNSRVSSRLITEFTLNK